MFWPVHDGKWISTLTTLSAPPGSILFPVRVEKPRVQGKDMPSPELTPLTLAFASPNTISSKEQCEWCVCHGTLHSFSIFSATHWMYGTGFWNHLDAMCHWLLPAMHGYCFFENWSNPEPLHNCNIHQRSPSSRNKWFRRPTGGWLRWRLLFSSTQLRLNGDSLVSTAQTFALEASWSQNDIHSCKVSF